MLTIYTINESQKLSAFNMTAGDVGYILNPEGKPDRSKIVYCMGEYETRIWVSLTNRFHIWNATEARKMHVELLPKGTQLVFAVS